MLSDIYKLKIDVKSFKVNKITQDVLHVWYHSDQTLPQYRCECIKEMGCVIHIHVHCAIPSLYGWHKKFSMRGNHSYAFFFYAVPLTSYWANNKCELNEWIGVALWTHNESVLFLVHEVCQRSPALGWELDCELLLYTNTRLVVKSPMFTWALLLWSLPLLLVIVKVVFSLGNAYGKDELPKESVVNTDKIKEHSMFNRVELLLHTGVTLVLKLVLPNKQTISRVEISFKDIERVMTTCVKYTVCTWHLSRWFTYNI